MTIPLFYFLIAYGAFILFAGTFIFFNVMHLLAFGLQSFKTAFVALIYIAAAFSILVVSLITIAQFSWTGEVMVAGLSLPIINPGL